MDCAADGFQVRAIRADDAAAYRDFVARIDEHDLRRRFAAPADRPSDECLPCLARVDYDPDVTFVAVRQSGPAAGEIVGEARAYRYPAGPTVELGIVVRSDMKRRGVGRALMDAMIAYTKQNGLELIGQIAPDNAAMLALAKRCGMEVEHAPGTDMAVAHLAAEDTPGHS